MNGRYVVGVDGSSPSRAALVWAAQRAERDGRSLVLVHVETIADANDPAKTDGRDLLRDCVERIRDLHPRLSVTPVRVPGAVAWELGRATRRDDILVIGTHKTGFVNGRIMGSRSLQITMATDCTVVVIPDLDLRFRRGVVAGIDRQATAADIARIAAREAEDRGEGLLLVHSLETGAGSGPRRVAAELPLSAALAAARARAAEIVVRSRTSDRPPSEALLDATRGKALLVLGPGDVEVNSGPLRTVIHDVLLNANAPIMIARTLAGRDERSASLSSG